MTTLVAGGYRTALHDKLREEVDELIPARTTDAVVEEAADVVEVLIGIAGDWGVTRQNPRAIGSCAGTGCWYAVNGFMCKADSFRPINVFPWQ